MDLSMLPDFEITNHAEWTKLSRDLNCEHYGESVLRYSAMWAKKMEAQLANGVGIRTCAEKTAMEVEEEIGGTADFVYAYATQLLKKVWKHGDELARYYNI